jgi:hypothetical protein
MIIRSGDNPWILVVKFDSANVVQVVAQSEYASLFFVVPDLDFVIITSRYEKRLIGMEGDTSNRSYGQNASNSQYNPNLSTNNDGME